MRPEQSKITREAREWLRENPNSLKTIGEPQLGEPEYGLLGVNSIGQLIERMYDLGAKKVWVEDVVSDSGDYVRNLAATVGLDTYTLETTNTVIVELPDNPEQRKDLFSLHEELFGEEYDEEPEDGAADISQETLLFWWD